MRRRETDEEVRRNLPRHLHPLWNRLHAQFTGTVRATRTEVFLEYVEAHPEEQVHAAETLAEWRLKQALRPMLDFYETPPWAVRAVCPYLPVHAGTRILDPGCGSGAILRELGAVYQENEILGLEKDHARYAACAESTELPVEEGDFLTYEGRHDLVVSNPPYSIALEFVQKALTVAPVVAMLLRLPWLASMSRAEWHRENPAFVAVLPRRPSFTSDGKTDATEYAWFIWGTPFGGRWVILDCEKRKR